MVPVKEIKERTHNLDEYSIESDRAFLQRIGEDLLNSYGTDIDSNYMKQLSELLTEMFKKHHPSNEVTNESLEDFWIDVRGEAILLSRRSEDLYDDYFKKALKLGRLLKQLAEKIGMVAMPLIICRETPSLFG